MGAIISTQLLLLGVLSLPGPLNEVTSLTHVILVGSVAALGLIALRVLTGALVGEDVFD